MARECEEARGLEEEWGTVGNRAGLEVGALRAAKGLRAAGLGAAAVAGLGSCRAGGWRWFRGRGELSSR